ncbi:MAG TPA: SRPBCC family protein [Bryobacteraceae bacterium]
MVWHRSKNRKSSCGRPFLYRRKTRRTNLAHYGRFVQIERPRHVEYTWVSEATKGLESIVAVTFETRGDQTEVTLRHSGVPDDDMGRQHKEGWTWVLSMLAERFVPHNA